MHQKALAWIWAGDGTLSRAERLSGPGVPGGQVSWIQGGPWWVETELRGCWVWSDQGGPWLEEACGKLGQQEPSSQAELAADEGLSTALSASLAGPTPKPSKHLPFWQGLEQSCGWAREGPRCAGE